MTAYLSQARRNWAYAAASWGVFLGLLLFIVGAFGAAKLKPQLLERDQIALGFHCVIYAFLTSTSVLGIFGIVRKRVGLVKAWRTLLVVQIVLSFIIGVLFMYCVMHWNQQRAICEKSEEFCFKGTAGLRGATVMLSLVMWAFEAASLFIVHRYLRELKEKPSDANSLTRSTSA